MKKNNSPTVLPEEAIRFLDDMRKLTHDKDEPTISISIRLPSNILRSVKFKAKADGKKYQSLIVEYIRKGLSEK